MQAAKERQKALLASFAAQQKLFADTMLSDDSEDEPEEHEEQVFVDTHIPENTRTSTEHTDTHIQERTKMCARTHTYKY